jgi:hypothetical protein
VARTRTITNLWRINLLVPNRPRRRNIGALRSPYCRDPGLLTLKGVTLKPCNLLVESSNPLRPSKSSFREWEDRMTVPRTAKWIDRGVIRSRDEMKGAPWTVWTLP